MRKSDLNKNKSTTPAIVNLQINKSATPAIVNSTASTTPAVDNSTATTTPAIANSTTTKTPQFVNPTATTTFDEEFDDEDDEENPLGNLEDEEPIRWYNDEEASSSNKHDGPDDWEGIFPDSVLSVLKKLQSTHWGTNKKEFFKTFNEYGKMTVPQRNKAIVWFRNLTQGTQGKKKSATKPSAIISVLFYIFVHFSRSFK